MRSVYGYIALTIAAALAAFAFAAVLRPVVQELLAAPAALLVSPK